MGPNNWKKRVIDEAHHLQLIRTLFRLLSRKIFSGTIYLIFFMIQHQFAAFDPANSINSAIPPYKIMELSVQNQVLHKQPLNRIAFNPIHNVVAAIADASDTVCFYHYQQTSGSFIEIFQNSSRPSGKKSSLAWSPSGQVLALGSTSLQLWKLDDQKLVPIKTLNDDFIDIKLIAWSPDSTVIALGGVSKRNILKIRSLDGGADKQINLDLTISALSFDPFGKYLLLLGRNNILTVYNCSSLAKLKQVALSPNTQLLRNVSTVKQIRNMCWSPDFNFLACPSLDDSKVSLAFALSRSQNFKATHAFIGHASSISCARFNPLLFEWKQQPCSILALGDSHGVVSIWRVCSKMPAQPLLISNSRTESQQVIEQLEWSSNGELLFVNMMKPYLNVLNFNKNCFGRQMSHEQKAAIIEANFGVVSAAQIHKKQLQIYNPDQQHVNKQISFLNQQAPQGQFNFAQTAVLKFGQKPEYVKLNEQVIIKDKNNRKKIQPAVLVRKEDLEKAKQAEKLAIANNIRPNHVIPIQFTSLALKPLVNDIQLGKITANKFIDIKKIQNYSILQLIQLKEGEMQVLSQRTFSVIDYLRFIEGIIYVYCQGNLYIFDLQLNMLELPIYVGEVHKISINYEGDIYYISIEGFIRGFNNKTKQCYTPSPVPIHPLLQKPLNKADQTEKKDGQQQALAHLSIEQFSVEKDHNLYISISQQENRYFYDRSTGCWMNIQFNEGMLRIGHSLKITDLQTKLISDFFHRLNIKVEPLIPKGQVSIQQYESNLIYYTKHNPNRQLFKQNFLGLIRQLKHKGLSEKLRAVLLKYFTRSQSSYYERDENLRQKVKAIGGNVIEQFMHFSLI